MNWHYGYIILCHLLPSVYLNSPLSTQTHRSLCHAHRASAQGSQCLPFLSSVPYSVLPISVHSHSPGTWSWSLAKHRSSTLLQQRFRGKKPNQTKKTKKQNRTTTIIKRAAAENEVHSFAFRECQSSLQYKKKKKKKILEQNRGSTERDGGTSSRQQRGVTWHLAEIEEGQEKNRLRQLLSQTLLSLFYFFVSPHRLQAILRLGRCVCNQQQADVMIP